MGFRPQDVRGWYIVSINRKPKGAAGSPDSQRGFILTSRELCQILRCRGFRA